MLALHRLTDRSTATTPPVTRRIVASLALLAFVALGGARAAQASPSPLLPHQPPAALYPTGIKLQVTDPLSNFQKSCLWDLNCVDGGRPRTHTKDEDALGRTGGWLSFAEWDGKQRRQMTFTLFGSAYDTPAQAAAAAVDFNSQLTGKGFGLTPFSCAPIAAGTDVRQFCARYHEQSRMGGHYFSLVASEGTLEIELLSYGNARYQALKRVTFALAQAAIETPAVQSQVRVVETPAREATGAHSSIRLRELLSERTACRMPSTIGTTAS